MSTDSSTQAKLAQKSLDNLIKIILEQSIQYPVIHQNGSYPKVEPTKAYIRLAAEAEEIRSKNPRVPITFLSFNYDIAFDFALSFKNAKFTYCFEKEKNHQNLIRYCKLHGSLHWAFNNVTKSLINAKLDFTKLNNHKSDLLEAKYMCINITKDLWHTDFHETIKFPFIIPPTGNKPFLHSLLKPVWSEAAKALRNAELILIIGYSFPDTDPFFRNFLHLVQ